MYQLDLEGPALLMSSPDIKGEQGIALQNGQFLTLSVSDWPCLGTILCMYENAPRNQDLWRSYTLLPVLGGALGTL